VQYEGQRDIKFVVKPVFVAINFTKLKIILFYVLNAEERYFGQFSRITAIYPKNLSLSSKNMGLGSVIRYPGSGTRKKPIPDPGSGSRGQKCTGSRIRIRNTAITNSSLIYYFRLLATYHFESPGTKYWIQIQS
jgi:hypothetical protein